MASKLREFIGNMITTAGKVVLKILLGSSGENLQVLGHTGSELVNDDERNSSIPQQQNCNCSFCETGHMYKPHTHTHTAFPIQL